VDSSASAVGGDREIARAVREAGKHALVAVNKTDDRRARSGALEMYQLGFDPVFEIAAEHGDGVGDLLDAIVEALPAPGGSSAAAKPGEVSVAIVGRPNAGKSSLVNRLLREERMIVSETPGTTRDAVDTVLTWHRRTFRIVDTAGIRRPGRVGRGGQVESVSVLLARRAIESADVVVLVVDASQGATDQDAAIAGEADRLGRGIIIVANKWDLTKENGPDFVKGFDEELRRQLKFLNYATILHISAATGERTPRLLEAIDKVAASRQRRVKTTELNKFVERISAEHPPASPVKGHVRILYSAQTSVAPPTFVFFTNIATTFHFSYQRYLENRLREEFGFEGTPIRIHVRARRRKESSIGSKGSAGAEGSKGRRSKGSEGSSDGSEGAFRSKGPKRSSAKRRGRRTGTGTD
jgi:GTP-binding protein